MAETSEQQHRALASIRPFAVLAVAAAPICFLALLMVLLPASASSTVSGATLLAGSQIFAQVASASITSPAPALHRRAESEELEEQETETVSRGRTTLPTEASGQYLLGENGESVEIDLQPDRLGGYISRFGDQLSDEGEPLTFFFATSLMNGQRLSFTTRQVHGVWFSFAGTIVRGPARSREQDGYYRLEGTLILHDAVNRTEQSRNVNLPLAREYFSPSS
jgi:hypothetical protein